MKFIELSHRITNGLITFPGMPPVEITAYLTREECGRQYGEQSAALLDQIKMINISGTYLDAPLHCIEDGDSIADIPLEKMVDLPTIVVRIKKDRNYFDVDDFETLKIDVNGCAILLHSGHDKKFSTAAYGENPPYLTVEGAKWLIKRGAILVGIDSPLIDNMVIMSEYGNPVHDVILEAKSIVCEDLRGLEQMPDTGALLTAVPPAVEMASFPARVFAKVSD